MRESEDGRTSFRTVAGLMLIPIAGLLGLLLFSYFRGGSAPDETLRAVTQTAVAAIPRRHAAAEALPKVAPKGVVAAAPRSRGGDIVLIIDDLGFEGQPVERIMALDPNLNASILPNGNAVAGTARRFHARGFEVLCHLPMEPLGSASPGRGAILTSMSDDDIARLTRESIAAVPFARGVNNHMGSRATSDRRVMENVIDALPREMYFIDSRTSSRSVAAEVARAKGVRTAARHVFLDDVASESAVRRQLAALAREAQQRGLAIGIGHPYPVTVKVLAEEIPNLKSRGFRFVRASDAVR